MHVSLVSLSLDRENQIKKKKLIKITFVKNIYIGTKNMRNVRLYLKSTQLYSWVCPILKFVYKGFLRNYQRFDMRMIYEHNKKRMNERNKICAVVYRCVKNLLLNLTGSIYS